MELQDLSVSTCYTRQPARADSLGTIPENSKRHFLARVALEELSEIYGPWPKGPESPLFLFQRDLKFQILQILLPVSTFLIVGNF